MKKTERARLIDRADNEMSRYIRLFHADRFGYCYCCCCGKRTFWTGDGMDMGHFVPKGNGATRVRYLHHNCHTQCHQCNTSGGKFHTSSQKQVATHKYNKFMLEKYGQDIIDDLIAKKFQTVKFTNDELREIGDLYKEFADYEKKSKGL
jgi:hypothetical protein